MQSSEPNSIDERLELYRALHRLSNELQNLANENQLVQEAIGVVFERVVEQRLACPAALQHLDVAYQTLVGLAQFTSQLSKLAPSDFAIDPRSACAGIELTALVQRLSDAEAVPNELGVTPAGEYELFEKCEPRFAG